MGVCFQKKPFLAPSAYLPSFTHTYTDQLGCLRLLIPEDLRLSKPISNGCDCFIVVFVITNMKAGNDNA